MEGFGLSIVPLTLVSFFLSLKINYQNTTTECSKHGWTRRGAPEGPRYYQGIICKRKN